MVQILNTNGVLLHYKKHHYSFLSIFLPVVRGEGLELVVPVMRITWMQWWEVWVETQVLLWLGVTERTMTPLNDLCPNEVGLLLEFQFSTVLLRAELSFNVCVCTSLGHR